VLDVWQALVARGDLGPFAPRLAQGPGVALAWGGLGPGATARRRVAGDSGWRYSAGGG
jgi:hypothetical protein